ncbi:heme/hemin ABC transporter substrate-binding protein [Lacimicrobium alkaliphilum]|uniref:Hemin ABC transporter substrate-binding protein n=1 Tax=Lacimicrobium alkaliphilum TaxID=1526571 RepID=A0ABQ1R630_9ALTE|nr:ABC transporter substrate-binding protein [Lacimicrobium alkaliphilum]GGD59544.1 hemin ABC transporter substrate-binding protein [Lacimicrobium alkaliphilum]
MEMRASLLRAIALLCGLWAGVMAIPSQAGEQGLITAGGTLTDIIFALQAEQVLVATDSSSTSPQQATTLPQVGYYRDLSSEGVLSFAPQRLWVLEGGGSDKSLQQIEQAGVSVTHFAKPRSVEGLYQLIRQLASRLNASDRAESLIRELQQQLSGIEPGKPHKALFVLQASARGVVSAGSETVPQLLFDYNGLQNIITHKGFKAVSIEHLVMQQPELLVAPAHSVAAAGGKQAFCQQPALRLLAAAKHCRLLVMDSLLALGMTTRLPQAISQLASFASGLPAAETAVLNSLAMPGKKAVYAGIR